jgi:flavin reductase (DIM6/NTAB) family NADH-FMN oxidoreductase RutF
MPPATRLFRREALTVTEVKLEFSDREFRDALGLFATGIAVVTTVTADCERIGATVSSFNSVSLQPPLVLFSIARNAKAFTVWQSASYFAVNVLSERHNAISNRFAKPLSDKWGGIEVATGKFGTPILTCSLAWFECERYANYDGGDHLIILGRVLAVNAIAGGDQRPLVFFRSKYRQLDNERTIETPSDATHWFYGW